MMFQLLHAAKDTDIRTMKGGGGGEQAMFSLKSKHIVLGLKIIGFTLQLEKYSRNFAGCLFVAFAQ